MNTPTPLDAIPLPPLPEPAYLGHDSDDGAIYGYDTAHMNNHARLAVTEALAAQAAAQPTVVASGAETSPLTNEVVERAANAIAALDRSADFLASVRFTEEFYRNRALSTASTAPAAAIPADVAKPDQHNGNDTEPRDLDREQYLDARGDGRGQGLDSYWKWGHAAGWNDHKALASTTPQPTVSADVAKLVEALTIGREAAYEVAQTYHASMAGYRQYEHDRLDADVKKIDDAIASTTQAEASVDVVPLKEPHHLWSHPLHSPRVARPSEATFAHGEPEWVREYPVEVYGPAQGSASDEGEAT